MIDYLLYVIQLFNELYINDAILHHCTIIKDILAYQIFIEKLAEFPTILDQYHKCTLTYVGVVSWL